MNWNSLTKWGKIKAILSNQAQTIGLDEGTAIFNATSTAFGKGVDNSVIPFVVTQTALALGANVTVVQEAEQRADELAQSVLDANNAHANFETRTNALIEELQYQINAHNSAIDDSQTTTKNEVANLDTQREGVEAVGAFFVPPVAPTSDGAEATD